jgi:hypothetical protein
VSLRVPSWAKEVLEEKGVDYKGVLRELIVAMARVASGEARRRLEEAFAIAESAWTGKKILEHEEVLEAVRCPGCP